MAGNDFDIEVLARLFAVIESRKGAAPEDSYTAKLFADGRETMVRKLGEEATETILAAMTGDNAHTVRESADLLYHLLVLWADCGIAPDDVWAELARREGTSGLEEKRNRKN
jgi:phosphoribosyl-ATP pyrophosphohydrolase